MRQSSCLVLLIAVALIAPGLGELSNPLRLTEVTVYGTVVTSEQFARVHEEESFRSTYSPIESTRFTLLGSERVVALDEGLFLSLSSAGAELKGERAQAESTRVNVYEDSEREGVRRVDVVLLERIRSQVKEEISREHWMADLRSEEECEGCLGSLTLAEVALPGTHDSGTFNLTTESTVPPDEFAALVQEACAILNVLGIPIDCSVAVEVANELTVPWAVTATTGWTGQLLRGGRSFDYRGYYKEESDLWVIEHSVIGSAPNTTAVLLAEEVRAFLSNHPGEIVLIEYKCANGNCTELAQRFLTHLGPYGYHWTKGVVIPGDPTLAKMVQQDMRAILVEENGGQRSNVTVGIVNDYPDSCNLTQILSYDSEAIQLFAGEEADAMRKIGYQATADVDCIVRGFVGQLLERDSSYCVPFIGFDCSIQLLGYIDQLNQYFTLGYVLDAYALVKPISQAHYFGNLWNVDNVMPHFADVIIALNAILLVNDVNE